MKYKVPCSFCGSEDNKQIQSVIKNRVACICEECIRRLQDENYRPEEDQTA